MTRCNDRSWARSENAFAHYKLLEMLDVFSLCVQLEQSANPTYSSPVVPSPPLIPNLSRTAPDTSTTSRGSSSAL